MFMGVDEVEDFSLPVGFGVDGLSPLGIYRGVYDQHALRQDHRRGINSVPGNDVFHCKHSFLGPYPCRENPGA